jgi:GTPase Era involved in 16S rRNA processing
MGNTKCFKYKPAEGKVWSLAFNHPLRLNSNGEKGRWTRRSLRTIYSKVADGYVNEMKDLLSHEDLWEKENGKLRAEKKYSPVVTSAFYDSILPEEFKDNESTPIRENLLPLPSSDDGYNKVLFVGTTGAGKSTLLRQLIGTTSENFPLTTTGKATVSDLEVIVAEGNYKSVVTFFTRRMTQAFIQECVYNALLKAMNDSDKKKIFEEFSENKEQTFRLKYILGNFQDKKPNVKKLSFFDDDISDAFEEGKDHLPEAEDKNNITEYLEKMIQISNELKLIFPEKESDTNNKSENINLDSELLQIPNEVKLIFPENESETNKKSENLNLDSELLQKGIYENKGFKSLVNEIIKDIESRFSLVNQGVLHLEDKWPQYWEFETTDRKEFLNSLRVFSSNNYKFFGHLLTPLVQGMRVQGPFYSRIVSQEYPKLVFIDGQGLGHTAESAQARSIPQKLENMFDLVDTILLVDNATQPMQHSSLTALKRAVASGYTDRLMISFTHFDLVKGENFESIKDKKIHVYNFLRNGLSDLEKDIGPIMVERLGTDLSKRCLFLENIDKNELELRESTLKQLYHLLKSLQEKTKIAYTVAYKPQYEVDKFCDEIYSSIEQFRMMWDMRLLGVATRFYLVPFDSQEAKKEHWRTIQALNRRITEFGRIEYGHLQPVSELKSFVSEPISRYLNDSLKWGLREPSNEDKLEFTDAIRRNISRELGEKIKREMIDELIEYWKQAYRHSGTGSTKLRSNDINNIYDLASPLIKKSANWREYISKIKTLFDNSIDLAYETKLSKSAELQVEPSNFIEWKVS